MNLFEYISYKSYLRDLIRGRERQRGYQAGLARAAGCQPSYLSQVLGGKADLLPEHGVGIAAHIELNELEADYFFLLLNLGRAKSKMLKDFIEKRLSRIRETTKTVLVRSSDIQIASKEIELFYYTSWYWSAVHIATSIEVLQTASALADHFRLPLEKIREILKRLEDCQLVRSENERWIYQNSAGYLIRDSIMTELNHTHWRSKAVSDIQTDTGESLHYTGLFSMSKDDVAKLREFFIDVIDRTRQLVLPSHPEMLQCILIDSFTLK